MNRCILSLVMILGLVSLPNLSFCSESSDKVRPTWIKTPPKPLSDNYYFKVVETDAGGELETSRKHSQKNLINGIAREFNIEVSEEMQSTSTTHFNNQGSEYSGQESYTLNVKTHDGLVNISYERVDEYYEVREVGGRYIFHLYTLYAVSRTQSVVEFDDFRVTAKYGAGGLWRSVVIPGWGQFHKGSKVKGGVFLGGVATLAVGAIYTENERASYAAMIAQTQNVANKVSYNSSANNLATARNICIGGAAVLYIYNLVDAATAPGAKRVIVKKRDINISPMVSQNGDVGLSGTLTF